MKRILVPIVLLLATTVLAAPPQARPQQPEPRHELLSPSDIARLLDLSEGQKQQIAALAETLRATTEPLREQLRANQQQLEAAVAANDAQRAGELLIAARALRVQIDAARDAFEAGFEALLTSEQRVKWAVYREIVALRRQAG